MGNVIDLRTRKERVLADPERAHPGYSGAQIDHGLHDSYVEAHGVKGMKNTPWRRVFRSEDHLSDWSDKNDAEVHGMRPANSDAKIGPVR